MVCRRLENLCGGGLFFLGWENGPMGGSGEKYIPASRSISVMGLSEGG